MLRMVFRKPIFPMQVFLILMGYPKNLSATGSLLCSLRNRALYRVAKKRKVTEGNSYPRFLSTIIRRHFFSIEPTRTFRVARDALSG
jgi:hypothetical protein